MDSPYVYVRYYSAAMIPMKKVLSEISSPNIDSNTKKKKRRRELNKARSLNVTATPSKPPTNKQKKASKKNSTPKLQQLGKESLKNKCSVDFKTCSFYNYQHQGVLTSLEPEDEDVKIIFKKNRIPVNKAVLQETCAYFQGRLKPRKEQYRDCKSSNCMIDIDVSRDIFQQVVQYLNTGTIILSIGNLPEVTKTANFLMIDNLKKFCLDIYKKNMDLESVDFVHNFADVYDNLFEVCEAALLFKVKHFETILKSGLFLTWKRKYIEQILRSDQVVVSEEKKVLSFLFGWLSADYDKRGEYANGLLQYLRYSFLTETNLTDVAKANTNDRLVDELFDISRQFSGRDTPPRLYHKGIYTVAFNSKREVTFGKFCPEEGTFKSLPLPNVQLHPTNDIVVFVANRDKIIAIDGISLSCQVFDPLDNVWELRAPLDPPDGSFEHLCACSFKDEIFAFYTVECGRGVRKTACLIYAVKDDKWRSLPVPVPVGGGHDSSVHVKSAETCGDSIFMVLSEPSKMLQYKPSTQLWSEIPVCARPNLSDYKMIGHKTKILFTQSYSNRHLPATNRMLVFCTKTKKFKKYSHTNGGRTIGAFSNNYLYIVDIQADGDLSKVEKFDQDFIDELKDPVSLSHSGLKSDIVSIFEMVIID